MTEFNKPELLATLKILFDLDAESMKDMATLSKPTLGQLYSSYILNAKEANNAVERARKHSLASSGSQTTTKA